MQGASLTKTPQTKSFYARVVARIERHADKLVEAGEMVELADRNLRLALAFDHLEPRVSEGTARLYRAALIHAIESNPGPMDYGAMEILQPEPSENTDFRLERLAAKRAANLTSRRGPQQKAKWVSETDWQKLLVALRAANSIWSDAACDWILATLATGLRPCEWAQARLQQWALIVQNAKSTNGRSHSATRTVDLSGLDAATKALVSSFLARMHALSDAEARKMYDGVRELIRVAGRRVFTGRDQFPTLYSARHCFAARAKATHSKAGVAALMGHASINTAGRHYAHSRHARGGRPLEIEPAPQDVKAVRRATSARSFISQANQPTDGT
jgi:integrase